MLTHNAGMFIRKNAKCVFKQKTELRYPALRIKNRDGGEGERLNESDITAGFVIDT